MHIENACGNSSEPIRLPICQLTGCTLENATQPLDILITHKSYARDVDLTKRRFFKHIYNAYVPTTRATRPFWLPAPYVRNLAMQPYIIFFPHRTSDGGA